jgi:pSer/pThr/pTyr-binding forkhead associated (FHA) protein
MKTETLEQDEFSPDEHLRFCEEMNEAISLLQRLGPPPTEASLVHDGPGGQVQAYPVRTRLMVGRAEECGLSVPTDRKLSERHFVIRPDAQEEWVVEDLGSRNGTTIGTRPLTRRRIGHGDVLRAGRQIFVFHAGPDDVFERVWAEGELD